MKNNTNNDYEIWSELKNSGLLILWGGSTIAGALYATYLYSFVLFPNNPDARVFSGIILFFIFAFTLMLFSLGFFKFSQMILTMLARLSWKDKILTVVFILLITACIPIWIKLTTQYPLFSSDFNPNPRGYSVTQIK